MHILEIPSFFTPYGGEFCLDQAKALKALGHEVRILSNVQLGMTIGIKDYLRLPYRCFEHEVDGLAVYQYYQRGIPKMVRLNVRRWVAMVKLCSSCIWLSTGNLTSSMHIVRNGRVMPL